jgi:hypothetical protein
MTLTEIYLCSSLGLSRYFEASLGTKDAPVAGMDHRRPFPFNLSKRINVLLALFALILLTPALLVPGKMFRDLFRTLLKIIHSKGEMPL